MREHLADADSYHAYTAEITSIFYYDYESKQRMDDYSAPDFMEHDVMFEIVFSDYEAVRSFLGASPNPDIPISEYKFCLDVTKENNKILFDNGFYDAVTLNSSIEIVVSDYIYMDGEFFFVAAVTYNDTEYLNFESGLSNITQMINNDKSLF